MLLVISDLRGRSFPAGPYLSAGHYVKLGNTAHGGCYDAKVLLSHLFKCLKRTSPPNYMDLTIKALGVSLQTPK